jgi:IPT/TIG domain
LLTVNGSHFVSSSKVVVNDKALAAIVNSSHQLQILLTPDVISGPGTVKVSVLTPSGNS